MMYYYRYHFVVTIDGIRLNANVNANNPSSAYQKAKRLYPLANKIHLVRSEQIK